MAALSRPTFLLSGLLLFASTVSAQTIIDLTTSAGQCTYTTPGAVTANPANGHLTASQSGTLSGTGCPTASSVPAVSFGPAALLSASPTSLSGGTAVGTTFAFLPLYATSCTGSIATTAGSGSGSFTGGSTLCNSVAACAPGAPLSAPATFTNTSTTASSTYKVSVTCNAATGASPATTTSNAVTISQAALSSGGTPSANFTFATSGLTANFTDTSTDSGGTINAWSWTFGDGGTSTQQNPSHTYAAAGNYSVTETVTDSGSSHTQSSKTQSVTVSSASGSCATIGSSTSGITSYTRLTKTQSVSYQGGFGGVPQSVDPTQFSSVYQAPWPGNEYTPDFGLPITNYLSEVFTVPANFLPPLNSPNPFYGSYIVSQTGFSTRVSLTISTSCGDFSNPTASGSTVLPGCYANAVNSVGGQIEWNSSGAAGTCLLSNGTTYYLNIISANIANVTPGGGTAASTSTPQKCGGGVCSVAIYNLGTW